MNDKYKVPNQIASDILRSIFLLSLPLYFLLKYNTRQAFTKLVLTCTVYYFLNLYETIENTG